ncbi:MAG: hypothetical protein Q7N50_06920 [Armatimonadota bacterium]|nr:hypothetical protein [Armatimonadota bacterium]
MKVEGIAYNTISFNITSVVWFGISIPLRFIQIPKQRRNGASFGFKEGVFKKA